MYVIRQDDLAPTRIPCEPGTRFPLPAELGDGFTRHCTVEHDLDILETRYDPRRDFAYDSVMEVEKRVLVMTFGIEGSSVFVAKDDRELRHRKGYTTIATFQKSAGQRRYFAAGTTHQLRLLVGEAWLIRHLGEPSARTLFRSNHLNVLACQPTSALSASSVSALLRVQSADSRAQMLRKGLALTALAGELALVERAAGCEGASALTARGIRQLQAARDLLESEMAAPPSIRELARRVGISERKLKAGFQELYGTTPYGLLLDMRMRRAWSLLQEKRCHVATAGYEVGYCFASNFSAAFTRYFGVAPKRVRQERLPLPPLVAKGRVVR